MVDPLHYNLVHRINIGDTLTRSADRAPLATALVEGGRRLTYREFDDLVNRFANALMDRGIQVGDTVSIASGNSIEFLTTYYACAKIGAVCVPINLGWRGDEVRHVLDDSGARLFVIAEALQDAMIRPALNARSVTAAVVVGEPDDRWGAIAVESFSDVSDSGMHSEPEVIIDSTAPLTYLYTSGTTSLPKGVVGSHTSAYMESMSLCLEGRFARDDVFAAMMPMFHTAQLNAQCTPAVLVGAAIHILPGFDAGTLLSLIETERITQLFGLPMMYRAMLEDESIDRRDLASLRGALYAMAPMPQTLLERCIERFDCGFYLLFGQTEMSPTTTIFRPENQLTHPGSVGTPVANVRVAIMDPDGTLLPTGESGEIVYRGPHALTEYLARPDATEEAFAYGWFHSGDIGHFDSDGLLWYTDRRKDLIKTGGENVWSLEVEKAVYSADQGIAEAVVVGLPHEHWSEAITAFVVPKPGATLVPDDIHTAMRTHIDAYKIPKRIVVVDELPKTSTGKIQKNLVRDAHIELYG